MADIQLNAEQKQAMKKMLAWWEDVDTAPFVLEGYAGTGKTTLVSQFLLEIQDELGCKVNKAGKSVFTGTGPAVIASAQAHVAKQNLLNKIKLPEGAVIGMTLAQLMRRPQLVIKYQLNGHEMAGFKSLAALKCGIKDGTLQFKSAPAKDRAMAIWDDANDKYHKYQNQTGLNQDLLKFGYFDFASFNKELNHGQLYSHRDFNLADTLSKDAQEAQLVILDEVGLVSDRDIVSLMDLLMDKHIKLLALGDHHQLQPVHQSVPNVLLAQYMGHRKPELKYFDYTDPDAHADLKTVVRQQGNQQIINKFAQSVYATGNYQQARINLYTQGYLDDDEKRDFTKMIVFTRVQDSNLLNGWRVPNQANFQKIFKIYLGGLTNHGKNDSWSVLTYTNRMVRWLNEQVRLAYQASLGQAVSDEGWLVHDRVIVNDAMGSTKIHRNAQFEIMHVYSRHEFDHLLTANGKLAPEANKLWQAFKKGHVQFVKLRKRNSHYEIPWQAVNADCVNGIAQGRSIKWLDHTVWDELHINEFNAKKLGVNLTYWISSQLRDLNALIAKLNDEDGKNRYMPAAVMSFIQLCYAMTDYKAQGQEYDNVMWYDEGWMHGKYCHISQDQLKHIFYTAVTRAKKMFIVMGGPWIRQIN